MVGTMFKNKKIYLGIIILIATAGSLFFFPMNIGGRYTCFYHRLFDHSHPVTQVSGMDHQQDMEERMSTAGNQNLSDNANREVSTQTTHHGSILLDNYLHQYAFPWWASIGLLALGIYLFLKIKRNLKEKESSLTANH